MDKFRFNISQSNLIKEEEKGHVRVSHLKRVNTDTSHSNEPTLKIQPSLLISENDSFVVNTEEKSISEGGDVSARSESILSENGDKAPHSTIINEGLKPEISEVALNSEIINEVVNNDTPTVLPYVDVASEDLQNRANLEISIKNNDEKTILIHETDSNITEPINKIEEGRSDDNSSIQETEDQILNVPKNLTDKSAEDIPSFSEWAQKKLEEVEKNANFSAPSNSINVTKQNSGAKLRWKNYASVDCGAKVILANPEAQNTWAILSPSRDEYKLNPCNSRIWFIVELCEAIQVKKIDLANYELFSSSPKEFSVSVSDRFPTRDWSVVAQVTAKDERDIQSFDINTETFGKYVKVEIKSHYGSEHYCPLSLFRAYGTSVFEVLQKDDPAHEQAVEDEDDDDTLDQTSKGELSGNLLSSATDAVLSMVKKAAQVLGNKVNRTDDTSQNSISVKPDVPIIKSCSSPSHYVVCNNCSDVLFGKMYELLSCKQRQIRNLVSIPYITKALLNSVVCKRFGFDLSNKAAQITLNSWSDGVQSFFPEYYLGALCNALAITNNKVLYNISQQYSNTTKNMIKDDLEPTPNEMEKPLSSKFNLDESKEKTLSQIPSETLSLDKAEIGSKFSCSTDTNYVSQIKPSEPSDNSIPLKPNIPSLPINPEEAIQPLDNLNKTVELPNIDPSLSEISTESPLEFDVITESSTEENIEKLDTEINSDIHPSVITATPTVASGLQGQKESIFLRLSNRIKALERNMSLSGQYLEELSKRYKKQVEEMQRVLEKTEETLSDVTKKQEERYKKLEERLDSFTSAVEHLLAERNSWKTTSYWLSFLLIITFLVFFVNKISSRAPAETGHSKPIEIQRRNSVDVVTRVTIKKKKRRPSDQALKIVTSSPAGDQDKPKRRKKYSNPLLRGCSVDSKEKCPSVHTPGKSSNLDWTEGQRAIEDVPFALEESDNSALEYLPIPSVVTRIEPPAYINTATKIRSGRSSLKNGKPKTSDMVKPREPSPVLSCNGSSSSSNEQTPKKSKNSFKKLFRKVF